LTAGYGDGHNQVAGALQEVFTQLGVRAEIVDCSRGAQPSPGLSERVYAWSTRYMPEIYGASYHMTAGFGQRNVLWRLLSAPSAIRLSKELSLFNPDALLRLFPDHSFHLWLSSSGARPFIATVLTDYSIHGRWYHPSVDTYYVPHPLLEAGAHKFANPEARVVATGIPLRGQFSAVERDESLDSEPYILVATGGRGLFPELEPTLEAVREIWPSSKVYVMCGRNETMRERVDRHGRDDGMIEAIPYVENVATWYRKAQFAVTKAGGITVSECVSSNCPIVTFKPQPGQEEDNANFLQSLGVARIATHLREFREVLLDLKRGQALEKMRAACKLVARPQAAQAVAHDVLEQLSLQSQPLRR